MKRHLPAAFLVVACLCLLKPGYSQSRNKELSISFRAGLTSNTVVGSMVDRNEEFEGPELEQGDKVSFAMLFDMQKQLSENLFLTFGLGYVQKNVNPMQNGTSIYRDELKTGYITVPVTVGANFLPVNDRFNILVNLGPALNFRLIDKSLSGPDRVDFKTSFLAVSLNTGVALRYELTQKVRLMFQYQFIADVSNSYVETLYWSNLEPNKKFEYKYRTHLLALGFQWPLK
jgi:hypothetical protein